LHKTLPFINFFKKFKFMILLGHEDMCKEDVISLYNLYIDHFSTTTYCLAYICCRFKISFRSIKNSGIHYCDRSLRRRIKSILLGDGDGNPVFLSKFQFIIFKGNQPVLNKERRRLLIEKISQLNEQGIAPTLSSLRKMVYI
jgi:hypothetical protein